MTDDMIKQAIRVSIRNAHTAGRLTKGSVDSLETALEYAESLILPMVEVRVQQGIEDAWRAHLQAAEAEAGTDVPPAQAASGAA